MFKNILLIEEIAQAGLEILKDRANVQIAPDTSEVTIVNYILEADALVVRSSRVTARIINAGKKLKVIGRHGIGVDNIDLEVANRRGIAVVNTPDANIISVAEHVIVSMLTLCKGIQRADRALRAGVFDRQGSLPGLVTQLGYTNAELYGKTLGLIGAGKIGKRVAKMCIQGFGMKVCGYDAFLAPEAIKEMGIEPLANLEEVLKRADFISLHIPLTADTKNLIGNQALKLMKPTAYLINTARGGIVEEKALFHALKNNVIAGAAIDVFKNEPPSKNHPIFQLDNVIVTPHMAAMTDGALYRMAVDVANKVLDALEVRPKK